MPQARDGLDYHLIESPLASPGHLGIGQHGNNLIVIRNFRLGGKTSRMSPTMVLGYTFKYGFQLNLGQLRELGALSPEKLKIGMNL